MPQSPEGEGGFVQVRVGASKGLEEEGTAKTTSKPAVTVVALQQDHQLHRSKPHPNVGNPQGRVFPVPRP